VQQWAATKGGNKGRQQRAAMSLLEIPPSADRNAYPKNGEKPFDALLDKQTHIATFSFHPPKQAMIVRSKRVGLLDPLDGYL
jgi:hypothetical protein